jgi:hypothetical protein
MLAIQAASLNWNFNSEPDVNQYKVYIKQVSNGATTVVNVGNTNRHNLTNLVNGVDYQLTVSALNTAGLESEQSDFIEFSPASGVPPTPSIVAATAAKSGQNWIINLSWQAVAPQFSVEGYWVSIKQDGLTFTNHFTTNLNAQFTVPVKNPTQVYLQSTNYFGMSSTTPVMTLNQPGKPARPFLNLP